MTASIKVTLDIAQAPNGAYQVSIGAYNENGAGGGYRLGGPKYNGDSKELASFELDDHDVAGLRRVLDTYDRITGGKAVAR